MYSSCSSELTSYRVSHDFLQHHHHHWRHHHHRQRNQHNLHQLFQSNLIFRIPTTSLLPQHALPSFSGWDGLPHKDFRWLQLNANRIGQLSLHFYSLLPLPPSRWSSAISRTVSTGSCLLSLFYRSPRARGCYQTSQMMLAGRWWQLFVSILQYVNHSSRLPRASSDWFLSFVFRQRYLWSIGVMVFMLMMEMRMTMLVVCNFTVTALWWLWCWCWCLC